MGDYKVTIYGLDFMGLLGVMDKTNRRHIKITLDNVEAVFNDKNLTEEEKYKLVRKYVLDGFNELTRTLIRVLFDDEEIKPRN